MEPKMHHTDEDDDFASSTMAAEGSQPDATPLAGGIDIAAGALIGRGGQSTVFAMQDERLPEWR